MKEEKQSNSSGFLIQGSILAIASIISRILGLVYRVPLTAIIGKTGNDYYSTAYEVYNIILLISSYSIPLAVSKMVAARVSKKQIKGAYQVFKGAMIFALCSGGAAALLVFFGAEFFTGVLLKTPLSALALKILAPTLFVVAIVGVLRGFFQGLRTMVPSAISQIVEQIINAIISIVAAYYLYSYGAKVGAVLGDKDSYASAFGAAGGTLGTAMGALGALVFLLLLFFAFRKRLLKVLRKKKHAPNESYGEIFRVLLLTIIPVLLSTTIYNISSIIDQGIFKNIVSIQGYDAKEISEWWGVFSGQYKVLINVPISIASALAASCVPSLTAAYHSGDKNEVRKQISLANRFIMVIAFPCAVGMAVLGQPIMKLLFFDSDPTSGKMLMIGAISIVFYSLSTLSNGILQGLDKMNIPVRNALIALVLHILFLLACLEVFDLNIFAVILANAFYALCMCFLNGRSVRIYSGARQDIRLVYIIPGIASLIMGAFVFASYKLINIFAGNAIATIASIVVGIVVYFVAILLLRGLSRDELKKLPKGRTMASIADKLHLLRD